MGQEIALEDPSPDAKQSPAVLDSIGQCSPVVIINGLAAILFMLGYVLFGVAMIRTVTLPRWSGVQVAVGPPAHLPGFGIAQLASTAAWPIAVLSSVSLGAGLAWPVYRLRRTPAASDVVVSDKPTHVSRGQRLETRVDTSLPLLFHPSCPMPDDPDCDQGGDGEHTDFGPGGGAGGGGGGPLA